MDNKLILAVQRIAARIANFLTNSKKSAKKYDSLAAVQVRIDKLRHEWVSYEEAWTTWQQAEDELAFKEAAGELDETATEKERRSPAFEEDDRDNVEAMVEEAELYLQKLRAKYEPPIVAPPAAGAPVNAACANIRLPAIKPPTFSGEWEEWVTFRDVFKALVNDNASLHDVHRLHLLREACIGKAADEIAGIALADGNFATAWDALVRKFETNG